MDVFYSMSDQPIWQVICCRFTYFHAKHSRLDFLSPFPHVIDQHLACPKQGTMPGARSSFIGAAVLRFKDRPHKRDAWL